MPRREAPRYWEAAPTIGVVGKEVKAQFSREVFRCRAPPRESRTDRTGGLQGNAGRANRGTKGKGRC